MTFSFGLFGCCLHDSDRGLQGKEILNHTQRKGRLGSRRGLGQHGVVVGVVVGMEAGGKWDPVPGPGL